ncbi:endoplasmic protein pkr1 [Nannochloropsis oceanica]
MSTSSQIQAQRQRLETTPKKLGLFQSLLKPGWDSAEIVIPFLHKCLGALLAVLLYTAQHNDGHVRIHLLVMSGLTMGLWGSVTWFVREYRAALAKDKLGGNEAGEGAPSPLSGEQENEVAPAAIKNSVRTSKSLRYTD